MNLMVLKRTVFVSFSGYEIRYLFFHEEQEHTNKQRHLQGWMNGDDSILKGEKGEKPGSKNSITPLCFTNGSPEDMYREANNSSNLLIGGTEINQRFN